MYCIVLKCERKQIWDCQPSMNSDCGPSWELAEGEKRGCILFPVKITFFFFFLNPYVYKELLAGKLMKETSRHFF